MANNLANYVYISQTKVDMLFSQIPKSFLDKYSIEINIKLPYLFEGNLKSKDDESECSKLITKLNLVIKYLKDSGEVGSLDDPKAYFEGILPMKWGVLKEIDISSAKPTGTVYFTGYTKDTMIGLGGSSKHVIGLAKEIDVQGRSSLLPFLIESMLKALESNGQMKSNYRSGDEIKAIVELNRRWEAPQSKLKFLATKLVRDSRGGLEVILGSPLYVALE